MFLITCTNFELFEMMQVIYMHYHFMYSKNWHLPIPSSCLTDDVPVYHLSLGECESESASVRDEWVLVCVCLMQERKIFQVWTIEWLIIDMLVEPKSKFLISIIICEEFIQWTLLNGRKHMVFFYQYKKPFKLLRIISKLYSVVVYWPKGFVIKVVEN